MRLITCQHSCLRTKKMSSSSFFASSVKDMLKDSEARDHRRGQARAHHAKLGVYVTDHNPLCSAMNKRHRLLTSTSRTGQQDQPDLAMLPTISDCCMAVGARHCSNSFVFVKVLEMRIA